MRHKKTMLTATFLLGIGLTGLQAQEATTATGGDASGSGGSVSYSVGQVVYITNTGTNGSVAQGVQQPYEISTSNSIEEAGGITLQCSVYPNPAADLLVLKVENYKTENLNYQLFDMNGKQLISSNVDNNEATILTGSLVPATYFLKVNDHNKELKTFKIIKN
jgi:hypothetical protein